MSIEELISKYIASTEKVMREMKRTKGAVTVTEKNLETSLTSIAYCEGLLDALKLLGAVKFEWPARIERKK
jgi:hypothetical protein